MPSRAVLFDLDGTLADTAPDLAAAVNRMRLEQGHEPLPIERLRPFASAGARGLLHAAYGIKPDDAEYAALRETFLEYYAERVCEDTAAFPGHRRAPRRAEGARASPGASSRTRPRASPSASWPSSGSTPDCVACGDTTPHLKPHPAPLLHACGQIKLEPAECTYLGDDLRDMKAAQAAGMRPIAVEWGYHHPDSGGPGTWQAAAVIHHPLELIEHL